MLKNVPQGPWDWSPWDTAVGLKDTQPAVLSQALCKGGDTDVIPGPGPQNRGLVSSRSPAGSPRAALPSPCPSKAADLSLVRCWSWCRFGKLLCGWCSSSSASWRATARRKSLSATKRGLMESTVPIPRRDHPTWRGLRTMKLCLSETLMTTSGLVIPPCPDWNPEGPGVWDAHNWELEAWN